MRNQLHPRRGALCDLLIPPSSPRSVISGASNPCNDDVQLLRHGGWLFSFRVRPCSGLVLCLLCHFMSHHAPGLISGVVIPPTWPCHSGIGLEFRVRYKCIFIGAYIQTT